MVATLSLQLYFEYDLKHLALKRVNCWKQKSFQRYLWQHRNGQGGFEPTTKWRYHPHNPFFNFYEIVTFL